MAAGRADRKRKTGSGQGKRRSKQRPQRPEISAGAVFSYIGFISAKADSPVEAAGKCCRVSATGSVRRGKRAWIFPEEQEKGRGSRNTGSASAALL